MRDFLIAVKVAARFLSADVRKDVRNLVSPINKPKGIAKSTIKEQAATSEREDTVDPSKHDIRPEDAFSPKPKNMNVLDFARTGWPGESDYYKDMEKAISTQIPKDKGYDTVSNLSQYLVETKGGGGTKPVGR